MCWRMKAVKYEHSCTVNEQCTGMTSALGFAQQSAFGTETRGTEPLCPSLLCIAAAETYMLSADAQAACTQCRSQ